MAENKNIQEALTSFSKSLRRFTRSGRAEPDIELSESRILQGQIKERAERLKAGIVQTYRIYKSPFEALGKNSSRAASINADEQALFRAYNLYKQTMDLNSSDVMSKETSSSSVTTHDADGMCSTFISRIEITSPLTLKASYTAGGQFIYLLGWLCFEQNCREYMPFFTEKDNNTFSLCFAKADSFELKGNDKEIFEIIRQEFYS